jgi:LytS/YehU family sensor histidine kinase
MRFENSLFYELPTSMIDPEAKVVHFSLQLLLENTVKHNVVSEKRPCIFGFVEKLFGCGK